LYNAGGFSFERDGLITPVCLHESQGGGRDGLTLVQIQASPSLKEFKQIKEL